MAAKRKPKNETADSDLQRFRLCSLPEVLEPDLSHITNGNRARLVRDLQKKWVNGTNLTYYFFKEPASWRGGTEQEQAVRDAFQVWKDLGIGLSFQEVDQPADAMIRIGFDHNPYSPVPGSWSYVGRDCVDEAPDPQERTTNFGWDLTTSYGRDTALHELGHVLGFPHEHQNPKAGIVWDEEKVYADLSAPPNNWPRRTIEWNILRKIPANTVDGSVWDKDSIMHYEFKAGLIKQPERYQAEPLIPESGLSQLDIDTVRRLYPPIEEHIPELRAFESQRFTIAAGEQLDFTIKPQLNRQYTIETFGKMDTVLVLFEVRGGTPEYVSGDDDSGFEYNAKIVAHLKRNREYIVRARLYYIEAQGEGAVMLQ